jgi:hypothetical protein
LIYKGLAAVIPFSGFATRDVLKKGLTCGFASDMVQKYPFSGNCGLWPEFWHEIFNLGGRHVPSPNQEQFRVVLAAARDFPADAARKFHSSLDS